MPLQNHWKAECVHQRSNRNLLSVLTGAKSRVSLAIENVNYSNTSTVTITWINCNQSCPWVYFHRPNPTQPTK